MDDEIVYTKFCQRAAERYKDIMCDIRGGKARVTVEDEILQAWQEKWNEPQYQHRRQVNSQNRRSEHAPGAGMSVHTCGSRSMSEHIDAMTKKNGGKMPTAFDVFKKTHTRKNEQGEHVYVCKKAEEVADEYHQEIETEQSQCNNNQEGGDENSSQAPKNDPNEVFYKTVKGKSKKRQKIYGLGPCASQYYSNSVSEIGTSSKTSTYDEAAIEKIKEEYTIKLQTEVETLKKTLEDSMQQKFQQMYMLGPPPPWAYPPPSQGASGYWSGPPTGMGAAGSSSGPPGGPWWGGPSSAGAAGGSSGPPVGPWWGGPPSGAGAKGGSSGPPASSWWSGPPGWWSTSTPAPKDTNVDASTDVGVDVGTDIDVDTNVDP